MNEVTTSTYPTEQKRVPVGNGESKFLDVGIIVKIRLANQIVDFALAIGRRAGSGFNHSRCLHIC